MRFILFISLQPFNKAFELKKKKKKNLVTIYVFVINKTFSIYIFMSYKYSKNLR